jgi:multicomponent Na+:H+ antiporter subunit E
MVPRSAREPRRRFSTIWFFQVFCVLLFVWIALNGLDGLLVGTLAAAAGAGLGTWLTPEEPYPWRPLRWAWFAGFFIVESFRGGFDVAMRAIRPDLPIDPVIERRAIVVSKGKPTMLLTSFISLLPGTLSVWLDPSEQVLQVHYLAPETIASVDRLEQKLAWVFGDSGKSA